MGLHPVAVGLVFHAVGVVLAALEFFFRGFLVFAGQPLLGAHAVPVMAFAYCLLHIGKPMPEAVSRWPTLAFTEPMRSDPRVRETALRALAQEEGKP